MERIKYLDFDILIEKVNDRYRARVLQSPAGQASAEFTLPFSDFEVENLMLRVGRNRRGVRKMESPEMQAAKQFGGKLFDAVFAGEVRGALRSSVDAATRESAGLRMRLRLADAPELVDLPWEFLYNASLNRFLALSNKTPLVRYIELPETPRPLKISPPLRVLVMISSPNDYEHLDVEKEWQKLNAALGDLTAANMVTLERLDQATLGALRRKLRQAPYHVLHFIGHGGFDAQSQDGVLLLEDEQGRGKRMSGQYLATVLTDHDSLRLIVLNACEGARTSRSDPFAGVAQSLVQQGIPAVIAMQFEITDEASITFAHEFYSALADSYPVDAALSGARSAIFTDVNDLEWGTPVLYLRAPDGMIFEPLSEEERAQREQERRAQEQRARQQQIEAAYLAAQSAFEKNDFDAAEQALTAIFALDALNADAHSLQTKIQTAREQQRAEQERATQEQNAHAQTERERQPQIESLYRDAQSAFEKKDFDAAEKSLAALFALDAENAEARALQEKIGAAREQQPRTRSAVAPIESAPTFMPERAPKPAPQTANAAEPFYKKISTRTALLIAGVIAAGLLLLGGVVWLGSSNSQTPQNVPAGVTPAASTSNSSAGAARGSVTLTSGDPSTFQYKPVGTTSTVLAHFFTAGAMKARDLYVYVANKSEGRVTAYLMPGCQGGSLAGTRQLEMSGETALPHLVWIPLSGYTTVQGIFCVSLQADAGASSKADAGKQVSIAVSPETNEPFVQVTMDSPSGEPVTFTSANPSNYSYKPLDTKTTTLAHFYTAKAMKAQDLYVYIANKSEGRVTAYLMPGCKGSAFAGTRQLDVSGETAWARLVRIPLSSSTTVQGEFCVSLQADAGSSKDSQAGKQISIAVTPGTNKPFMQITLTE